MELEDLEQELMCEVLSSIKYFDERRGRLEPFIKAVLNNCCLNILRSFTRLKRGARSNFVEYNDSVLLDDANDVFQRSKTFIERRETIIKALEMLPMKHRLTYQLSTRYSNAEVAKIIGLSHTMVSEILRQIGFILQESTEKQVLFLVKKEDQNMSKNLSVIEKSSVQELSRLKVHELADLNEQLAKLINHTKEIKSKMEDALNLRFLETAKEKLRHENRDTGTTKFIENGLQITAEIPKKVTWDTAQMEQILKTISEEKRKAIVKVSYAIEERKYAQLSPADQELFQPARTVIPGKTRFQISIPEEY